MSPFAPEAIAQTLFRLLRKSGFSLGMGEYLAALDVLRWEDGPQTLPALKVVLRLLWCHSFEAQRQFDLIWEEVEPADLATKPPSSAKKESSAFDSRASDPKELDPLKPPLPTPSPTSLSNTPTQATEGNLTPYPLRTPLILDELEARMSLQTYFPVTRRSLAYLWRYLRRPVADGPLDVLDLDATIEQVTRQGFFLAPVYRRREVNQASLILLIDQDGSMTPFHRFTRDLVETAKENSWLQSDHVEVYYFHNVPADYVYADSYLTHRVLLEHVLANCDSETSMLIISDAGAARGYRRRDRIQATTEWLTQIQQRTSLVSWLNPMPRERWESTSAAVISHLVRMEPLSEDGMGNAIDVVRGQPLVH